MLTKWTTSCWSRLKVFHNTMQLISITKPPKCQKCCMALYEIKNMVYFE